MTKDSKHRRPIAMNIADSWRQVLHHEGLQHYGLVRLDKPLSIDVYKKWLQRGWHGNMQYLEQHWPQKLNPQNIKKDKSFTHALVLGLKYAPHPRPLKVFKHLRVALYAQGEDYHHFFRQKLQCVADELKKIEGGGEFLAMSDSHPVLERDLAYRAGLGWVGKNTCLIHPQYGSLFFIGEIYMNIDDHNTTGCSQEGHRRPRGYPTGPLRVARAHLSRPPMPLLTTSRRIMKTHSMNHKNKQQSFSVQQKLQRNGYKLGHGRIADMCGTCNKCIEACPTGALVGPRQLDARKCISYLNIEAHRGPQQSSLAAAPHKKQTLKPIDTLTTFQKGQGGQNKNFDSRTSLGDWFFGCDICQTICPWNQKTLVMLATQKPHSKQNLSTAKLQEAKLQDVKLNHTNKQKNECNITIKSPTYKLNKNTSNNSALSHEIQSILQLSNRRLMKRVAATPLSRAGAVGLKKNALVVAGNLRLVELHNIIEPLCAHPRLGSTAIWALNQIKDPARANAPVKFTPFG